MNCEFPQYCKINTEFTVLEKVFNYINNKYKNIIRNKKYCEWGKTR